MKRTKIGWLVGAAGFVAAASLILTRAYYGAMQGISVSVSVTLWARAAICVFMALKVKARIEGGDVGMDRSQMNPVTIAQLLVVAKASAWTGALVGGGYLGVLVYVISKMNELVAAADDFPGALASTLGGAALSAAGLLLEKYCEAPPPPDGESIG